LRTGTDASSVPIPTRPGRAIGTCGEQLTCPSEACPEHASTGGHRRGRAAPAFRGFDRDAEWAAVDASEASSYIAGVTPSVAYQQLIDVYAAEDPQRGKTLLSALIDLLRTGLPAGLDELAQLGRTLHRRRDDILAYFEHRASNGPTEAINGRLEALRRNALGFRDAAPVRGPDHGGAHRW
jgi:hypothetical protein